MVVKRYNKLVRDQIPQIIEKTGKKAIVQKVEGNQYLNLLREKLQEELQEYLESGSIEELADLVEVVYGILAYKNISNCEFEKIRENKNRERGSFKEALMLIEVIEE
ncbi:MAG: nucleoside triphosphate pyrophosphohydrolase [Epulopiscium sp.]|nr:nucleoside triphosphate pyrophosphohydrolase [Candidatus Epulonipiscium sp.]